MGERFKYLRCNCSRKELVREPQGTVSEDVVKTSKFKYLGSIISAMGRLMKRYHVKFKLDCFNGEHSLCYV